MIEQRGKCERGKKPLSRSIKQVFGTFEESFENRTAGQKDFFDTLKNGASVRMHRFTVLQIPFDVGQEFFYGSIGGGPGSGETDGGSAVGHVLPDGIGERAVKI